MASSLDEPWSLSLDTLVAIIFGLIGAFTSLANIYFAWRQLTAWEALVNIPGLGSAHS